MSRRGIVAAAFLLALPLAQCVPTRPACAQSVELASARAICVRRATGHSGTTDAEALAVADLDEDGHLDLVVPDAASSVTEIFFGDGRGEFSVEEIGGSGTDLAVVDLNRDGHLDLLRVVGSVLSSSLGDGARFLGPGRQFSLDFGRTAIDLEIADFDADGAIDAAVACRSSETVAVLLGDGAGGFSLVGNFDVLSDVQSLAVADFDEDGRQDFAACLWRSDAIRIRFGDGTGLFPRGATIPVGDQPWQIAARDVDGDLHADLVVASTWSHAVEMRFGDGLGGFPRTDALFLPLARSVFFDDVNRDGEADLFASSDRALECFMGDDLGGFSPSRSVGRWIAPRAIAAGDFDEDGCRDLVTATENALSLLFGDGTGGFPYSPSHGTDGDAINVGDWNGDGHLDVVAARPADDTLAVHLGDGRGGLFSPPVDLDVPVNPVDVLGIDVDLDGALDVATCLWDRTAVFDVHGVAVHRGDGAGGFSASTDYYFDDPVVAVATADFDRDGLPDLAVAGYDSTELTLLRGRGDGSFEFQSMSDTDPGASDVVAADFDGDGDADVAVSHGGVRGRTIRVFRGDGAGSVVPDLVLSRTRPVNSIAAFDVDDDGALDLIGAESDVERFYSAGGVSLFLGDGAGGFSAPVLIDSVCEAKSVVVADLDEDSRWDLVVTDSDASGVCVLTGDGPGSFAPARCFSVYLPRGLGVGDFDEDGHVDVAVADDGVRILRNETFDSLGAFPGNVNAAAGPVTSVLFVNGMRGDGPDRRLEIDKDALFVLRMKPPPSLASAAFALFAWIGESRNWTITELPDGYGRTVIPAPPNGGRPKRVWNNTGDASFGVPHLPSVAAPTIVLRRERGVRKRVTFTLQGIVEDPASTSGVYAATNAITVVSR